MKSIKVTYKGVVPDLFREGQGVVTEGMLDADGNFTADTVLAKHDENYMPKEVADSLKAKGVKLGRGQVQVIVELGHFALVLALAVAAYQMRVPLYGAWRGDTGSWPLAIVAAILQLTLIAAGFHGTDPRLSRFRFLGIERRREFPLGQAADLQNIRRMGKSRRLHVALGLDPRNLWQRPSHFSATICR